MKMGRWGRVLGEKKKVESSGKRKKRKVAKNNKANWKKKIQAGHSYLAGDLQVSDVYLIPYQDVTICEVRMEDHQTTTVQSEISSDGSPHLARGGGGVHCQFVQG